MNRKPLKKLHISKYDAPIIIMYVVFGLFVGGVIAGNIAGFNQIENDKKLNDPRLNAAIDSLEKHRFHYGARRDNAISNYEQVRKQVLTNQKSKAK